MQSAKIPGRKIVFSVLACLFSSQAWSLDLVRGPYLQLGTPSSMIVRWRTEVSSTGQVDYGLEAGKLGSSATQSGLVMDHQVKVEGLRPDTRYFYSISSDGRALASGPDYFFYTHPARGQAIPTRIWAIGDFGNGSCQQRWVRDAYYADSIGKRTNFIMTLGDNAYPEGSDDEYQTKVFEVYPTLFRNTEICSIFGNHDTEYTGGKPPYFEIFNLPTHGELGGFPSGDMGYFSYDYGNIHFIALSEGPEGVPTTKTYLNQATSDMVTWLKQDLAGDQRDWTIAYWHQPPYSKGTHDSDIEDDMMAFHQFVNPVLEQGGVDLVVCGHSHSYERSYLLNGHYGDSKTLTKAMVLDHGDGREDGNGAYHKPAGRLPRQGTVYVVAGSAGGAGEGGSLSHPAHFLSMNVSGSLVLELNQNRLDAKMLDFAGRVEDYFTLTKGENPPGNPSAPKAEDLHDPKESIQFDFEKAPARGWLSHGGLVSSMELSRDKVYHGKKSLAVDLVNTKTSKDKKMESYLRVTAAHFPGTMRRIGIGSVVSFRLWVPGNGVVYGVEPYLQDSRHAWYGNMIGGFKPDTWNTYKIEVPCGASLPLEEIGCHFYSAQAGKARVYLDMISSSPAYGK
jgi:hypothetical protein